MKYWSFGFKSNDPKVITEEIRKPLKITWTQEMEEILSNWYNAEIEVVFNFKNYIKKKELEIE